MANIFKKQQEINNHPKRNNFDLSFQNHLTMEMGKLYPVLCQEVVPGDSFDIETAFGLKFMPIVFPVQSHIRAVMHFYYVRAKNLWKQFPDWISGLKTAADGVVHPYIKQSPAFFSVGSICDYLNVPTTLASHDTFLGNLNFESVRSVVTSRTDGTSADTSYETIAAPYHFPAVTNENDFTKYYGYTFNSIRNDFSNASTINGSIVVITEPLVVSFPDSVSFTFRLKGVSSAVSNLFSNKNARIDIGVFAFDRRASNWRDCYSLVSSYSNVSYSFSSDGSITITFNSSVALLNNLISSFGNIRLALCFVDCYAKFNTSNSGLGGFRLYKPFKVTLNSSLLSTLSKDYNPFVQEDGIKISALPFRAYESIYNCFYRNTQNDPFLIDGKPEYNVYNTTTDGGADTTDYKLMYRNYELDYLTSALPSPQQGNAPLVGMSSLGSITLTDDDGSVTTARAIVGDDGNSIVGVNVTSPIANKEHALTLQQIASAGFSINDFRNTNALQRWLETNIRKGYRYLDFIEGHFGSAPSYKEMDMPEFIGGFSRDVQVSQIVSTADTLSDDKGAGLGSFVGSANCFGGSKNSIRHYCDDYGFIVGILSIVPTPAYSQLLPKHYLKNSPLDYYFPEFSKLGMQPITYEEVTPVQRYVESKFSGNVSLRDTFGYQRPNYDLVSNVDQIHGLFRTDLSSFLINRVFDSSPSLGQDFLKIGRDETSEIFVDQSSSDQIIGQIAFKIYAKRPIPRVVIPSLGM